MKLQEILYPVLVVARTGLSLQKFNIQKERTQANKRATRDYNLMPVTSARSLTFAQLVSLFFSPADFPAKARLFEMQCISIVNSR